MPRFLSEEAHEQWCDREYPEGCIPLPVDEEPTERLVYCLECGRPADPGGECGPCGVRP